MNNIEGASSHSSSEHTFEDLKTRLDEIVEIVNDDTLPLEEALKYYEEAVTLGLEASNILEQGIAESANDQNVVQDQEVNKALSTSEEVANSDADSSQ